MSLPQFEVQGSLFESLVGDRAPDLFRDNDKYKLFAQKIWPLLADCRTELAECYRNETGRPGVEGGVVGSADLPVLGAGVRPPGRRVSQVSPGWKLALNLKLNDQGFHPTPLVYFRHRPVPSK